MSKRSKGSRRLSRVPRAPRGGVARRRRRMFRVISAVVGGVIAATGGWLYAGSRPTAPEAAESAGTPAHARTPLGLGPLALSDPVVRGGSLQVPIVDWTEMLPTCH
ncbi:MAG: hypothetical protein ACREMB_24555 [Candidatus Rokuibacteriota bacterium]